MKAYVGHYSRTPEHQALIDAGKPVPNNWEDWVIEFFRDPRINYEDEREAEEHLLHIRAKNFRYKDHHCKFNIEQVADGKYAIFCVDHPAEGVRP